MYIVVGESGVGTSYRQWNVAAYKHPASARIHAELANRHCAEHNYHWFDTVTYPVNDNPWDPRMEVMYPCTHYYVDEVADGLAKLREHYRTTREVEDYTLDHEEERPA